MGIDLLHILYAGVVTEPQKTGFSGAPIYIPDERHKQSEINKTLKGFDLLHILYAGVVLSSRSCSIVTAERLYFCVRYGNRCGPLAINTSIKNTNYLLFRTYELVRNDSHQLLVMLNTNSTYTLSIRS